MRRLKSQEGRYREQNSGADHGSCECLDPPSQRNSVLQGFLTAKGAPQGQGSQEDRRKPASAEEKLREEVP